jgi:hypothetical protein
MIHKQNTMYGVDPKKGTVRLKFKGSMFMKNFLSYFSFLFCMIVSCVTQPGVDPSTQINKGSMIIREKNSLAITAFVDGKMISGKSPLIMDNILAGPHKVRLFYPYSRITPESLMINVTEGKYSEAQFEVQKATGGSLSINTEPSGMIVTLNGLEFGTSPLKIEGLLPGNYAVNTAYSNLQLLSPDTVTVKASENTDYNLIPDLKKHSSVLEYFSNTSCIGCPAVGEAIENYLSLNPAQSRFLEFITFHPYFPSANDPFYRACETDQKNRFDLYEPTSLPVGFCNGMEVDWDGPESEPKFLQTVDLHIKKALNETPVAEMFFSGATRKDTASISGVLNIQKDNDSIVNVGDLSLYIALIEDNISFPAAPGTNLQKDFTAIFRGFSKEYNGTAIPVVYPARLSFTLDIRKYWRGDLRIIAFLQDKTTKKIYQTVGFKL